MGLPLNWDCCIIEISDGLSLKLLAVIGSLVMLGVRSWTPKVA